MTNKQLIFIIKKWDMITVSTVSIIYGLAIFRNSQFVNEHVLYDLIVNVFNNNVNAFLFIAGGVLTLASLVFDLKNMRVFSVGLMSGVWSLFGTGFILSPTTNNVYIFCYAIAIISFGSLLREWLE